MIWLISFLSALLLVSAQVSNLVLFESNNTAKLLSTTGGRILFIEDGLFRWASCRPIGNDNPGDIFHTEKIDPFRPFTFQNNIYISLSSQLWTIDNKGYMNAVYRTNGFLQEIINTPSLIILNKKIRLGKIIDQLTFSTDGTNYKDVIASPNVTTSLQNINGLIFVSSPGNAYVFDAVNGVINLATFCNGVSCYSPFYFSYSSDSFYYFESPIGIYKSDGKSSQGTSLLCSTNDCKSAFAMIALGKEILFFGKSNLDTTLYRLNGNNTVILYQFGNKEVRTNSTYRWAISDKFYFVMNQGFCSEVWQTNGFQTSLFSQLPCSNSLNVSIIHMLEPKNMNLIYLQVLSRGNTSRVEIWEINKSNGNSKFLSYVCSECNHNAEYIQVVTDDCLVHWSSVGLELRYTKFSEEEDDNSALSNISSYVSIMLSFFLLFVVF